MKLITKIAICGILLTTFLGRSQVVSTVVGSIQGNQDGVGLAVQLNNVNAICSDNAGNLYFGSSGRIKKMVIATAQVTTIAGGIISTLSQVDGIGTEATFGFINSMCYDGSGNLFITDNFNHKIRKIEIATTVVTTYAGSITHGNLNGQASVAQFFYPKGLCTDGNGNIYVADSDNKIVRKISLATGIVSTLAGSSTSGSLDGVGTSAQFSTLNNLCYDGLGNLYVVGSNLRKIQIATGIVTTINTIQVNPDTNVPTPFIYGTAQAVTYDGNGNLYIVKSSTIKKTVIASGVTTTFAGLDIGNVNGSLSQARFSNPSSIYFDNNDNLYIADSGNYSIKKISGISTLGINENVKSDIALTIYPNPTKELLNLNIKEYTQDTALQITNILGLVVYKQKITANDTTINISGLAKGTYILNITNLNNVDTRKLIIE